MPSAKELSDEFHMMIGYCVAEWAAVDDALFLILRDCIGPYEQSAIIFYRTPSLDARFNLTDEIVRSVLPKPARKDGGHEDVRVMKWKEAIGDYSNLLATRRRIAHQRVGIRMKVTFGHTSKTSAFNERPSWYEIYTNQHESLRGKKSDLQSLGLQDLCDHWVKVKALSERLYGFLHGVLTKHGAKSSPRSPQRDFPRHQGAARSKEPRRRPKSSQR
jgi:hypothetical protein